MAEQVLKQMLSIQAKPILKWAGGKTQMLGDLLPKVPSSYGRYIEPFFGGGAMFFALQPEQAIISDSNPELINLYRQVADNVDDVISHLKKYENSSEMFYAVRSQDWTKLPKSEAAARTIFLNKTCFNGLYRVNKKGQFNVPFGKYKNPKICDEAGLKAASDALKKAEIICGDYLLVLEHYAQPGDFVFLDPPYLPISEYSDFKRYTKEQFYEEDHVELAKMVMTLHERGCHVILTNSNHPLVHELYAPFTIDVIQTKRHISCNGKTRKGEDVIVTVPPKQYTLIKLLPKPLPEQVSAYATKTWRGSGDSKMSSDIKNWKQRITPVDAEDWNKFITGACIGNYNGQPTTVKTLKPVLYYYYVLRNCSPINQVNVSFDVDHIIPQERFVGNTMISQDYKDSLINLALLPTKDNICKKAKALNEITDTWLKLQITTFTEIPESEFGKYSDIANISDLCTLRSELFSTTFSVGRNTALSK